MIILNLLAIFVAFWVLPNYIIQTIEKKKIKNLKYGKKVLKKDLKKQK